MQTFRWTWYLFRLQLYVGLGILRFFSKPGSRVMMPLAIAALAFLLRHSFQDAMTSQVQDYDAGYQPEDVMLDVIIGIVTTIACGLYVMVSRILGVVLGAVPVMARPLMPVRRLKQTETKITSAVVKIAVPPLPKQAVSKA